MIEPTKKPKVKLVREEGNAFAILGRVTKALQDAGADKEYTDKYFEEATSGDYDNLLAVTCQYVTAR